MKKKIRYSALGFVVTLLFPACLFAQHENIWRGGKSGRYADWHVAVNWSKHRVPNEGDIVVIPALGTHPFVTGNVAVQSIFIESGAEVALRDRATFVVLHSRGCNESDPPICQPIAKAMELGVNSKGELVAY